MIISKSLDKKVLEVSMIDLLDSMYLMAVALKADGSVLYVNPYFLKVTGFSEEEVIGKDWFTSFIPEKKRSTVLQVFNVIIEKDYKMHSENPVLTKSGSELFVEWNNTPIYDKRKRIVGTMSIGVDITPRFDIEKMLKSTEESARLRAQQLEEQNKILNDTKKGMLNLPDDSKRLEEALQIEKKSVEKKVEERTTELMQEKARLEASINAVPSGFIVTDKKGTVIIRNTLINQILGSPPSTVDSINKVHEILAGNADVLANFNICSEEKKSIILKDITFGKKILELYMAPIFISQIASETIGVIILITDVTEEKVLERSKDEFFSIASHELRTPITAIRGNLELIEKYFSAKIQDASFREMLDDMRLSSVRLIHLVNEFLNTSKLEQGKMSFDISKFEVGEMIEEVVVEMLNQAKSKGLSLKFNNVGNTKFHVRADRDKVKEVLINLVANAVAYTEKGGVEVFMSQTDGHVKVSVMDTGKGIASENQKLLFRKFQQANANIYARDVGNSTGLGLYISKLLIESMGGEIFLEKSEVNVGSTFVFTLPAN